MYNILIVLFLSALIVSIYSAFYLEKKRKRIKPDNRPFTWGYYQGAATISFSVFYIVFLLMKAAEAGENDNFYKVILIFISFFAFRVWLGIMILKQRRFALVLNTVLSFVVPIWIINYFYIKNRWEEFDGNETIPNVNNRFPRAGTQGVEQRKICSNCEKRFEVVRAKNAEDGEFYECYICKRKAGGRFIYEVTDDEIRDLYPGLVAR